MKDRSLKNDGEEKYLILKSGRERRCEHSSLLWFLPLFITFIFLGIKYTHRSNVLTSSTPMFSRLQFIVFTHLLAEGCVDPVQWPVLHTAGRVHPWGPGVQLLCDPHEDLRGLDLPHPGRRAEDRDCGDVLEPPGQGRVRGSFRLGRGRRLQTARDSRWTHWRCYLCLLRTITDFSCQWSFS